jgi:hypothetical protein
MPLGIAGPLTPRAYKHGTCLIGNQKSGLGPRFGGSPLWRRRFALDCSANEEEEEVYSDSFAETSYKNVYVPKETFVFLISLLYHYFGIVFCVCTSPNIVRVIKS